MKLTALDIRQKTFEKSFRGVDKDEVQAFLTTISQQWERQGDENRELRLKLEHAQQDVQKMREVESSLYRTLKTAEDTGNNITEQAQRDADLRVREAQLQSENLLNDARQRARIVVDEAYQQAEKTVADMQREVTGLGQECQRLEQQLDTLVRDLHHLASDALDKVEKAHNRPKGGTASILSRAARVQVERPKETAANPTPPLFHRPLPPGPLPPRLSPLAAPLHSPLVGPPSPMPPVKPTSRRPTIPSPASSPTPTPRRAPILSGPRRQPRTPVFRRRPTSTSPSPPRCHTLAPHTWIQWPPKSAPSAPTGPKSLNPRR